MRVVGRLDQLLGLLLIENRCFPFLTTSLGPRAVVVKPRCCSKNPEGASVIECCYAASCTRLSSTMTKIVERASTDLTFSHTRTIVDEKISRNVSRRVVRPACMAGVLTSRPNFSARCGLTKL